MDKKIPGGTIVNIPKKGSLTNCNNWRGIMLSVSSKIIIKRISTAVEKFLRKQQAGFRNGRRFADHIFTQRNVIEQGSGWQRERCINCINFEKAFDSILHACGIPTHMVLIKLLYENYTCIIRPPDVTFMVNSRMRQGCVMSAVLFLL